MCQAIVIKYKKKGEMCFQEVQRTEVGVYTSSNAMKLSVTNRV